MITKESLKKNRELYDYLMKDRKAIFNDIEKALRTDDWTNQYQKLKKKWLE